ncbi:MAG: PKD domain-containing protein [Bacteroidetes bacterium]|nr:PKD domain-containing protein [Bacteroidota bacterium]
MRTSALLITFTLVSSFLFSQTWADVRKDRSKNFYEIQEAFNAEWADKAYEKGKGYKQFKRWEWFWEQRVFPSGEFPAPEQVWKETEAFKKKFKGMDQSKSLANWTPIGPTELAFQSYSPGIGRVNCVAQDPNNNQVVYVGTPGGGLWKSMDGGQSWQAMTDALPTLGVSGIAIDPIDSDIVYIGTGDGNADDTFSVGVLKSTNGGETFQTTGLNWEIMNFRNINKVLISHYDHNTLYAATDYGLWKTVDAANSWYLVSSGVFYDIELHPTDPTIVYGARNYVVRSTDGGENFSAATSGGPNSNNVSRLAIAISPDEPDWLYILAGRSSDQGFMGVYRSTNAGESFTLRADSPNIMGWSEDGDDSGGQAWYDMALAVNPNNASQVFVGGVNLWRSNNAGSSWNIRAHWVYPSSTGAYVHADIHALDYYGSTLYCGSDGGIFKSFNNGGAFADITDGIQNSQFYRMGGSATDEGLILAGAQDNGVILCDDGVCGQTIGADGMNCLINPDNPNSMYASTQFGNIRRSSNGGQDWDNYSSNVPETGAWITPFMLDPENSNVLFAGYESLWRRNGNQNWVSVSPAASNITTLNIAPSDHDYIYMARNSSLLMTSDGGENWSFINAGLPSLAKTSIYIHPTNPEELWVTVSGYNVGEKVFHSTDAGATWENVTLNLPNMPANTVVFDLENNGGLYVGMDVGIYYTNNDLVNWVPFFDGLPNVVVNELEIHEASGKLRAATYGRGLWETDLFSGITSPPVANFSSDETLICLNNEIQFQDLSLLAEVGWAWTFEGGSPSTSSEANPTVLYTEPGIYEVTLTVSNSIGEDVEVRSEYIEVIDNVGVPLPYLEGFETVNIGIGEEWFVDNPNGDVTWAINNEVGNGSPSSVFLNNLDSNFELEDELISRAIDLSSAEEVIFSFDVAFAQQVDDNKDKLRFYLSDNCGDSWVLKKTLTGNTTLLTADPTLEPFIPSADQWQTIFITNISQGKLQDDVRIKFKFENDGGNNIYIDNINILAAVTGLQEALIEGLDLNLSPNPAEEYSTLRFNLSETAAVRLKLLDMVGREVWSIRDAQLQMGAQQVMIPMRDLAAGLYVVDLSVNGVPVQTKLIKE